MKKPHYSWLIMISCCALIITASTINNNSGIFLNIISKDLGVGIGSLSLYITIQAITMSLMIPIATKIVQKHNINVVMSVAVVLECTTYMLLSIATSVLHFYISAIIMGVSLSFVAFTSVPILINAWFKKYKGMVLAIALSFIGIAGAILSIFGELLIDELGWRIAYVILGAFGLIVSLPFTLFVIKRKPEDIGLTPLGDETVSDTKAIEDTGITIGNAVKQSTFYFSLVGVILINLVGNIIYHASPYVLSRGYDLNSAALGSSAYMIGVTGGKFLLGYLSDKIGMMKSIIFGGLLALSGSLLLLTRAGGFAIILLSFFFIGIMGAGASILPPIVVSENFGQRSYNQILSIFTLCTGIIGAISASVYGFIYDATGNYDLVILIIASSILLSVICIYISSRARKCKLLANGSVHDEN